MRYLNKVRAAVGDSNSGTLTAPKACTNQWFFIVFFMVASLTGLSAPVHSAALNLLPPGGSIYPDFFSSNLQYNYTYSAGVGNLSVIGGIAQYTEANPGFTSSVIPSASFELQATLDTAACASGPNCVTSSSLRLFGDVRDPAVPTNVVYDGFVDLDPGAGINRDPNVYLLGSNGLSQFGFSNTSGNTGVLEFVFLNASGVVPAALGLTGAAGGMILTVASSNLTNFQNQVLTQNWQGTGFGDVFVPLPGAVWLLGSGLLGLFAAARRRRATEAGDHDLRRA